MSVAEILAFIWGVSAAICMEAYGEAFAGKNKPWLAISIGSLTPVLNTIVALCYARQKLKGIAE